LSADSENNTPLLARMPTGYPHSRAKPVYNKNVQMDKWCAYLCNTYIVKHKWLLHSHTMWFKEQDIIFLPISIYLPWNSKWF